MMRKITKLQEIAQYILDKNSKPRSRRDTMMAKLGRAARSVRQKVFGAAIMYPARGRREAMMSRPAVTWPFFRVASGFAHWAAAKEGVDTESPVPPNFRFPAGAEITFQWNYTCRNRKPCVFSCGTADRVKALTMYLGTIP